MLSTKSKFSLGLGCLVALLIAVFLVPPAVQAAAPTFAVTEVNSPTSPATAFGVGDTITITVTASVTGGPTKYVADDPEVPITLAVTVGSEVREFALRTDSDGDYVGLPGASAAADVELLFDYTVVSGETDDDGLAIDTAAAAITGFVQITDNAGTAGTGIVTITPAAAAGDTPTIGNELADVRVDAALGNPVATFISDEKNYLAGDTIRVKVAFDNIDDDGLMVTGTPFITLLIGPNTGTTAVEKNAVYDSAASNDEVRETGLIFSYELVAGDGVDKDGLKVKMGLSLNGGTITVADGEAGQKITATIASSMPAIGPDEDRTVDAPDLGVPVVAELTLPSGPLGAKGFAIITHNDAGASNTGVSVAARQQKGLPNLESLLGPNTNGGTIELVQRTVNAANAKTVGPIITEIMWGSDASQADPKLSQWIEIYNAGAAIADLSKYALKITPGLDAFTPDTRAVDTVSNLGNGRWNVPGQSGRTRATTGTSAASPVNLISMRRTLAQDGNNFKAKVDNKVLKEVKNGRYSGSWAASAAPTQNIGPNRIATPGAAPATQITQANRTSIPYNVVINEIGHSTNDNNIWIELLNRGTGEANLKKWGLSIITPDGNKDTGKEATILDFPDRDLKLGAGKVLLIVNKDPLSTPLARGKKFGDSNGMTAVVDQEKSGLQTDARFYDAKGGIENLPNGGANFLLVLRSNKDKTNHENIVDISGELRISNEALKTSIWPLIATPTQNGDSIDGEFTRDRVYKRNKTGEGFGEKVWGHAAYTGLGYDRSAGDTDANGGTPGFPNDAIKEKPGDLASGAVTISEIMVVSDGGRHPQWIELRNTSPTQGVNLNAWRLGIDNVTADDVHSRRKITIPLPDGFVIGPNQTLLIATRRGSSTQPINSHRVMLLWNHVPARNALEVENSRFTMLSMKGFTLTLFGKDQTGNTHTDQVTIGADLLTEDKIGNPEKRISLIRSYDSGVAGEWRSAKDHPQLTRIPSDTYYGIADDVGTPGYYPGTALPVSLSSFLPKRTDAGVVIKWTTQSELNNAGFNILRSATKTGEFVVINPTMIEGAGTTGEKQTYSYTDKTAKPNIVYYYQIEDVSFDGNRQRLTGATRLRGHIGAANKLTTTWGDLKAQD